MTWNKSHVWRNATKQQRLLIQRLESLRQFQNLVRLLKIGNAAIMGSITITKRWFPQVAALICNPLGHLITLLMMHATQWLITHGLESIVNSLELQLRFRRLNAVLVHLQREDHHLHILALSTIHTPLHSMHATAPFHTAGTLVLMFVNQSKLTLIINIDACCLVQVHHRRPSALQVLPPTIIIAARKG